jgi:hypothetical protein
MNCFSPDMITMEPLKREGGDPRIQDVSEKALAVHDSPCMRSIDIAKSFQVHEPMKRGTKEKNRAPGSLRWVLPGTAVKRETRQ